MTRQMIAFLITTPSDSHNATTSTQYFNCSFKVKHFFQNLNWDRPTFEIIKKTHGKNISKTESPKMLLKKIQQVSKTGEIFLFVMWETKHIHAVLLLADENQNKHFQSPSFISLFFPFELSKKKYLKFFSHSLILSRFVYIFINDFIWFTLYSVKEEIISDRRRNLFLEQKKYERNIKHSELYF